jgi:hypothetical protein
METYEKLKVIEENSFIMGNKSFKNYESTESIEALRASIEAYRSCMQAIRYQLIFNNLKK